MFPQPSLVCLAMPHPMRATPEFDPGHYSIPLRRLHDAKEVHSTSPQMQIFTSNAECGRNRLIPVVRPSGQHQYKYQTHAHHIPKQYQHYVDHSHTSTIWLHEYSQQPCSSVEQRPSLISQRWLPPTRSAKLEFLLALFLSQSSQEHQTTQPSTRSMRSHNLCLHPAITPSRCQDLVM